MSQIQSSLAWWMSHWSASIYSSFMCSYAYLPPPPMLCSICFRDHEVYKDLQAHRGNQDDEYVCSEIKSMLGMVL